MRAALSRSQQAARDRAVAAMTRMVKLVVNKFGVTLTTTDTQEIAQIVDDVIEAATPDA